MGERQAAALPAVAEVQARAGQVRERIAAAGGAPDRVRLLAVTKGFGADLVRVALRAGLADLGESYAQELVAKADELAADPESGVAPPAWHAIGRLQRNKVRRLAGLVTCWESVDRLELAREIARRDPGAAVLIQVSPAGEPQKGGCDPDEAPDLVAAARELGLDVRGLMAIAPLAEGDRSPVRAAFERVAALADDLGLPERSMGMSGDLEEAVAAGSTQVRVGQDLFGPRPPRP